jgi:hypothetical protein
MRYKSEFAGARLLQADTPFGDSDFRWRVPPNVRYVPTAYGRALATGGDGTSYAPLLVGDLFLTFAQTPLTPDGVLGFARRYGPLGLTYRRARRRPGVRGGEYLHDWRRIIRAMRTGVDLWQWLAAMDTDSLGRAVRWGTSRRLRPLRGLFTGWLFGKDGMPVLPPADLELTRDDAVTPCRLLLQRLLNTFLGDVALEARWDARQERCVLRVVPRHLLSALWLQFARAVTGEVKYRRCKVCAAWMPVASDSDAEGVRSDREFCSGACKQKDHRGRVKQAKQLKAERMPLRQVAARLGTTTEVIKRWLTKEK